MLGEQVEAGRQDGRHDVEPVGRALRTPALDGVRDLLRGAREGPVAPAAAESADKLADRQPIAPGQLDDQRVPALGPLDLVFRGEVVRQRLVERQPGRIQSEPSGQPVTGLLGHDELVELGVEGQRLGLGRADHRDEPGQDLDAVRVPARQRGPPLQVSVKRLALFEGLLGREHRLRVHGREIPPVLRRPGLHEQRMALRGAGQVERAPHPEELPAVVDRRAPCRPRPRRRARGSATTRRPPSCPTACARPRRTRPPAGSARRASGWASRPKLRAASSPAVVTMFQPARPPLTWSSDANLRARL